MSIYRVEEQVIEFFSEKVKSFSGHRCIISAPFLWIAIFVVCPCLILLKISFAESIIASPPYTELVKFLENHILQMQVNLGNYVALFTDEMYIHGFLSSVCIAGASTICCIIIGFPMAYAISRSPWRIQSILLMLVVLPFWTSFLIRVYAWIMLLSPAGFINNLLINMGIIDAPLPLINNSYAACLGIIYAYLPFMILPLYGAIEKIDYAVIEAAYDLGSSPFTVFFSIVVPLAIPGILAGSALVFIPAIGEFVIPELLGGAQTLTIGRLVWNEFFVNMSWPTAAALSILLLLFIVLPVMFFQLRQEIKPLAGEQ